MTAINRKIEGEHETRALVFLIALAALCLSPTEASASMGGIPQISGFLSMIGATITGPVAITLFMAGVIKCGANVYKCGIQGLADGGIGIAGAGAMLGGGPWLASQFGLMGALVP